MAGAFFFSVCIFLISALGIMLDQHVARIGISASGVLDSSTVVRFQKIRSFQNQYPFYSVRR